MEYNPRGGVAAKKVEAQRQQVSRYLLLFIFILFFLFLPLFYALPADFHFPADIQYFFRNGRYVPVWPGIWSGTKQSCFCSGISTGTANSGRISWYGTKSTSFIQTKNIKDGEKFTMMQPTIHGFTSDPSIKPKH